MFIFLGTRRVCFTKKARESSKFHRQGFANGNIQPKREVRRGKTIAETKRGECLANILLHMFIWICFSSLFIFRVSRRFFPRCLYKFFRSGGLLDIWKAQSSFRRFRAGRAESVQANRYSILAPASLRRLCRKYILFRPSLCFQNSSYFQ